jgi:hypothetical protein
MKNCESCKNNKEEDEFYNKKVCKDCINLNNIDILCSSCNETKNKSEFYRKKNCPNGIDIYCKKCRIINQKKIKIVCSSPKPNDKKNYNLDELVILFVEKYMIKTNIRTDSINITVLYPFFKKFTKTHFINCKYDKDELKEKLSELTVEYRKGFHGYKFSSDVKLIEISYNKK